MGFSNSLFTAVPNETMKWMYVEQRFHVLQSNLRPTNYEIKDGNTKVNGVISSLNRKFWNRNFAENFIIAGSWKKETAIRTANDADVLYTLSPDVFYQFDKRAGNSQSQLLQHIKGLLSSTYSRTSIRGDGQVVVVDFNRLTVEIVPAFHAKDGGFLICDTNNNGRWKHIWPDYETDDLDRWDQFFSGNVRKLTRIIKQWKRHCNVPIKSFHIEQLVKEALQNIPYSSHGEFWFDWLVRDIFEHMIGRAGGGFWMPGPGLEWIRLDDKWLSRTESAYRIAQRACNYEEINRDIEAGTEWRKIFGNAVPLQARKSQPQSGLGIASLIQPLARTQPSTALELLLQQPTHKGLGSLRLTQHQVDSKPHAKSGLLSLSAIQTETPSPTKIPFDLRTLLQWKQK